MTSIARGVILNDRLKQVVAQIGRFPDSETLTVTSGVRGPEKQLSIIGKFAAIKGVKFSEYLVGNIYDKVTLAGVGEVYRWQQTWSRLLALGVIVNPPVAAACLEDYTHPSKGLVKAGTLIQASPHTRGTALDFSGANNIDRVVAVLSTAKAGGAEIKNILIERENDCVHVDVA